MRNLIPNLALITAGLMLSTSSSRSESKPSPQLAPPNGPKSEFTFRPGFAKDPFFPRSTDNMVAPPINLNPGLPQGSVPDYIVLKGVSIVKDRKLAIINNYTVGEGEEFSLRRNGTAKPTSVRCVEIKDKSVVIAVDGVTKELILRTY
jgi:hypothetical protein